MSAHTTLGGVYTARFPYLDSSEDKIRPGIVVSKPFSKFGIIAIIPISSKATLQTVDVTLGEWKSAGLARASVARVHRLTTMLQSDLIAELGQLSTKDVKALKTSIQKFLDL